MLWNANTIPENDSFVGAWRQYCFGLSNMYWQHKQNSNKTHGILEIPSVHGFKMDARVLIQANVLLKATVTYDKN
jgi:hypothetical protein